MSPMTDLKKVQKSIFYTWLNTICTLLTTCWPMFVFIQIFLFFSIKHINALFSCNTIIQDDDVFFHLDSAA